MIHRDRPSLTDNSVRADYDAGDDDDDLEHAFFKKYERRNWSLILFEQAGRWGIRINPVSFGVSVIVIFFFAVRCTLHYTQQSLHQQMEQCSRNR